jgi:nitrite reductase (NADH) small subunit
MSEHVVAEVGDLDPGERLVVQREDTEIGVFRQGDEYRAYPNWCPHQGGPVCEGSVTGTQESTFERETLELDTRWTRDDEVLKCPWHGWEFDIDTGDCLSREKIRLPSYPVTVKDGRIIVSL